MDRCGICGKRDLFGESGSFICAIYAIMTPHLFYVIK